VTVHAQGWSSDLQDARQLIEDEPVLIVEFEHAKSESAVASHVVQHRSVGESETKHVVGAAPASLAVEADLPVGDTRLGASLLVGRKQYRRRVPDLVDEGAELVAGNTDECRRRAGGASRV